MTTLAAARAAFARQPVWLLKLTLDRCNNEYGVAPCTATGGSCCYTWNTCQDQPNYAQGSRTYKYANRGAPSVLGALPLLQTFTPLSTKIVQDKFTTESGEMRARLSPDLAGPLVDPEKTTTPTDTGNYWPNLLARNPNYQGRIMELYEGYAGVAEADFSLAWRGTVEDISIGRDGAEIMGRDFLWTCRSAKMPPKIDGANTVQDDPLTNVATTINVVDSSEFLAASAKHPRCVKIESEYITYTGASSNQLTGCTRGAFGTSNVQHVKGTAIAQVLAYGNAAFTAGLGADWILADLLYLAGITPGYWEVADEGVTLDGALSDSAATAACNNPTAIPASGLCRIGSEWISYTGTDASGLTGMTRGLWGTTAAAHSDDDPVYFSTATSDIGRWHLGALYRAKIEAETTVADLISDLARDCMADVFVNESGLVEFSLQAPPVIGTTVEEITRDDHWLDSRAVDQYEESRLTRVYLYYNAPDPDPGENPDDYVSGDLLVDVSAASEAAVNYGRIVRRLLFSRWIYRDAEANWLATHLFDRYQRACPIVSFSVESSRAGVRVGDLVRLTVPEIVNSAGTAVTRLYRVIKKDWRPDRLNEIVLECADTGYADNRYGLVAPGMGTLRTDITDSDQQVDIVVGVAGDGAGGGRLVAVDFRVGGEVRIGSEEITIGNMRDDSSFADGTPWVVLTGCTRGANGTTPASHSAGTIVFMLYAGASDDFRRLYCWIGDTDNEVDTDIAGYVMW